MTWHPDIPEEYRNQIVTGDARELAKRIPDESVDLVFTDPVYDRIDDYRWLAETAARVLKPGGSLLTFCAIGLLPQTHAALLVSMSYRWRFIIRPVHAKEFCGRLLITSQELLWYERDRAKLYQSIFDVQLSTNKGMYGVNGSNWGKGVPALAPFVNALSPLGGVVLDIFCGSGSIPAEAKRYSRNYIAFEIDPDTADLARQRVRDTQPPLPLNFAEQRSLFDSTPVTARQAGPESV